MIDDISQVWLALCGLLSIYFIGRTDRLMRLGCVFGLLAEPAWLYTSIVNRQWGIVVLAVVYTVGWIRATYNHFGKG